MLLGVKEFNVCYIVFKAAEDKTTVIAWGTEDPMGFQETVKSTEASEQKEATTTVFSATESVGGETSGNDDRCHIATKFRTCEIRWMRIVW